MVCDSDKGENTSSEVILHHDWGDTAPVSTTIVEGVAAVTNTPPMEFDPTLYEVVNPDALDKLFQPLTGDVLRDGSGQLTFELEGCTVVLDWSGRIKIEPLDGS